jgi:hypothetical protein
MWPSHCLYANGAGIAADPTAPVAITGVMPSEEGYRPALAPASGPLVGELPEGISSD